MPLGVTQANWEYAQASHISTGYDEFLKGDPLTAIDRQIIARYLPDVPHGRGDSADHAGPIVADFGCGNGRTLALLLHRRYRGHGIDLSIPMLRTFIEKESKILSEEIVPLMRGGLLLLQANLVELDGIGDDTVDHGISLFSTLGMIQRAKHRA